MINAFATTIPILVLVLLGYLGRRWAIVRPESIPDLKSLVIHLALPLVVFRVFGTMQFEARFLVILLIMFGSCSLVYFGLRWLGKRSSDLSIVTPFLFAGFEAGMVGYAVYGAAYGANQISRFAVIDLGHVLFIFFILVTGMEGLQQKQRTIKDQIAGFIKTPVIIGIVGGLIFNVTGLYRLMQSNPISSSILSGLDTMSHITLALVAFIIGYELQFSRDVIGKAFVTAAIRYAFWLLFALVVNRLVIVNLLHLDEGYQAAMLLMATLPVPYIVPIYLKNIDRSDHDYVLNTLAIGTVLFLLGLVVIKFVYP